VLNIKILFICKASIKEGLGHFIRTVTLSDYISEERTEIDLELILISDQVYSNKLTNKKYSTTVISSENDLSLSSSFDIIVLDMLTISNGLFAQLKSKCNKIISISPIFNQMSNCDMLISRTKYISQTLPKSVKLRCGLEYSIIRSDCEKISSDIFKVNIDRAYTNVAISMGGTDPENMTLKYLDELSKTNKKVVFWVLLGEGYEHNYKSLSDIIKKRINHEIILARTNKNMWHILSNCSIAVLKGGLTSYEAAYSGLPAINVFENGNRSYLVQELLENRLCLPNAENVEQILTLFDSHLENKNKLMEIHKRSQNTFTDSPVSNVIDAIIS